MARSLFLDSFFRYLSCSLVHRGRFLPIIAATLLGLGIHRQFVYITTFQHLLLPLYSYNLRLLP